MSSDGSGDNNSLKDEINKLIADNKVMVFSATYCKFELLRIITNQHFGFHVKVRIVRKQKKFLVNIN